MAEFVHHDRGPNELELRNELIGRGLSPRTVDVYVRAIQRAADHLDLSTCTPVEVSRWVGSTIPDSWSSRKLVKVALRTYWDWVGRVDPPTMAIRVPPKPRFSCRAMTPERARKLSVAASEWEDGPEGLAVLLALYPPVLRRFEIAKLQWDDVEVDDERGQGWLHVMGKGSVSAVIPIHPRVVDRITWWRDVYTPRPDPTDCSCRPGDVYLFRGRAGRDHVCPATIWSWVKRVAKRAGLGEIAPHELRHTGLANLNDMTKDVRATQEIARHADPATTVIYTRVNKERLWSAASMVDY